MTEKHLQQILSDYSQMSVDSLIELKNLIEDYPYCQTAQILYLLNLRCLGEDMFDTRLPYTAICVNNRQKLKCAVEKVDEILTKKEEDRSEPFFVDADTHVHAQTKPREKTISKQIFRSVRTNDKKPDEATKTFRSKTISELLNLQRPSSAIVAKTKHPQPAQSSDDKLLEQLRLEALAKVNHRLNEARTMINAGSSGTPNRMIAAQEILDKVIANNPKVSKIDESADPRFLTHWKTKEEHSLREDYEVVSETLAQLYIAQGAPAKAREIYKTLSKRFPEKADYFSQFSKQIKSNHKPTKSKTKK
ncbi:MAG: hypothetical protein LBP96_04625 [Bacteroidales bacterium]|jgi:tetratricopeptide (TPR) repeat protein|nr:hypothetical protein [Bacteroidales bacterium]